MAGTILPGFKALGGKDRNYVDLKTGAVISRRQYDKLRGIYYEAKAEANKAADEGRQLLAPARGRKSARKKTAEEKEREVTARKAAKEKAELAKKIEAQKRRKFKRRKLTKKSLVPGRMAVRMNLSGYDDYVAAMTDAKGLGIEVVNGYALGVIVVDTETGKLKYFFTMNLRWMGDKILTEDQFFEEVSREESSSSGPTVGYFIHFAYAQKYAESVAKKAGIKIKTRRQMP